MKKKIWIILILIIVVIAGIVFFSTKKSNGLKIIKSEKELSKIYDGDMSSNDNFAIGIVTMPFSFILNNYGYNRVYYTNDLVYESSAKTSVQGVLDGFTPGNTASAEISSLSSTGSSSERDYSTTNIQVENVDEADIIKTDGYYIYSISENNVIITDVRNPEDIKIAATINSATNCVPEELIIYKDKLVVISSRIKGSYYSKNLNDTVVEIYNIEDKTSPYILKDYELLEPYYTSRCIDNNLYIISSGNLRKENGKIVRSYNEDSAQKEIPLNKIKYMDEVLTRKQTLMSSVDLNNVKNDVNVESYLIDISNAYVSENSIYLLNEKYDGGSSVPPIKSIFGLKGIIGAFTYDDDYEYDYDYGYYTDIYKFNINKDGKIDYSTKTKTKGKTINQYSVDEYNKHLRVALYDSDGTRVVIFNENLKEIGKTADLAKGEKMYSSRFMGNKVYLVTYKTIDPLFVIDLSNEQAPKVLGKLKIPGYSSYLHPYDENHIIGIGMETEEIINRNSTGRVTSTTARITGMKMALFDVTNVENPIQISNVIIGDSRTTSSILTNPKALLFSKEKQLIAIPVNNYKEDFEIEADMENNDTVINSYTNYSKPYIGEGYFVYNINVEDGFKLKGVINHEKITTSYYYSKYGVSKLLRGLYINDDLYTVSESAIKVNKLDTLEQINELKIKK